MLRNVLDKLSGTHITLIIMTAIAVPSALYGAVNYSPVSIVDPNAGNMATVDSAHRLYVYDFIAGSSYNSLNFMRYEGLCNSTNNTFSYMPPSGKALILKSAELTIYNGTSGSDNYVYLYDTTSQIDAAYLDTGDVAASKNSELGSGFYVKNGETLAIACDGKSNGAASITGYLVGAAGVPAAAAEPRSGGRPLKHGRAL